MVVGLVPALMRLEDITSCAVGSPLYIGKSTKETSQGTWELKSFCKAYCLFQLTGRITYFLAEFVRCGEILSVWFYAAM